MNKLRAINERKFRERRKIELSDAIYGCVKFRHKIIFVDWLKIENILAVYIMQERDEILLSLTKWCVNYKKRKKIKLKKECANDFIERIRQESKIIF